MEIVVLLNAKDVNKLNNSRNTMKADGWTEEKNEEGFFMRHKDVKTQQDARIRLDKIKLLTNRFISLDIGHIDAPQQTLVSNWDTYSKQPQHIDPGEVKTFLDSLTRKPENQERDH